MQARRAVEAARPAISGTGDVGGTAGELVTREEIQQRLWPSGTFVDFENGLNSAVNRLRDVLGDSADQPRFIETIPRQGYRFLPDVVPDQISSAHPAKIDHRPANDFKTEASVFSPLQATSQTTTNWNRKLLLVVMALFIIGIGPSVFRRLGGSTPTASTLIDQKLHPLPLVTYGDGAQWLPAFSPDGSRIAYSWATAGGWYLEVKLIGSETRVRLTKTPQGSRPARPGPLMESESPMSAQTLWTSAEFSSFLLWEVQRGS